MYKKHFFKIVIFMILIFSNSSAQESWYAHWGLGLPIYQGYGPSDLNEALSDADDEADVNFKLNLDLLGFYFPVNEQAVIGFIYNSSAEAWADEGALVVAGMDILSVSGMYFFQGEIASGPYVRTDLGLGTVSYQVESDFFDYKESGSSIGLGLGGGYAIPNSSLTFSLMYFRTSAELDNFATDDNYTVSNLQLSIGWLW